MKTLLLVAAVSIAIAAPGVSRSEGSPDRLTICHRPGTNAERTLRLPRRAAERHIAGHGDTFGACGSEPAPEITQTFFDLEPTEPTEDEIVAPPVDEDTTFPPLGPPVEPGPPVVVDGHFWEDAGALEELPAESLEESFTETAPSIEAAVAPEGRWRRAGSTGRPGSGDVAIHAALLRSTVLPSGAEILFFAGSANTSDENEARRFDRTGVFRIIDPSANRFDVQRISFGPRLGADDLFCSSHAMLEDGRLLVAGGTQRYVGTGIHSLHFAAIRSSFIFDPKINRWAQTSDMNFAPGPNLEPGTTGGGRWYPTLLTLNNGNVLAFWGHPANDDQTRHTNDTPEYFDTETGAWQILGRESDLGASPANTAVLTYPRVHLLPNGRVFRATPVDPPDGPALPLNVEINPVPESLQSLAERNNISAPVSRGPGVGYSTGDTSYTSVLLPLSATNNYRARILLVGGPSSIPQLNSQGTMIPRPENITRWFRTGTGGGGALMARRLHANATILPTGEVFVSGGKSDIGVGSLARSKVLEGEIYNPFNIDFGPARANSWRTVAPAIVPREYHSVALLMPDGRVWHGGTSIDTLGGLALQETRIDLYEPWYFSLARPVIRTIGAPEDPVYRGSPIMRLHDSSVTVVVDHFREVRSFALVRAGSATHAFNSNQRYIEIASECVRVESPPFAVFRRFTCRLTSPPSSSIAPPGNYLLFALDDRRVPSVGRFIRIDRQFVGELQQEAEDFTTRGAVPVTVRDDGTVALAARREPIASFPRLEYGGVDFGPDEGVVTQFSALVSSVRSPRPGVSAGPGEFSVQLDRPDGPVIATLRTSFTDGRFIEQTTPVTPVSGVHNVFITFAPGVFATSASATVDWFKFKE